MQMGGGLRTGVARPSGFGEMPVTLELPRSAGCNFGASWSTGSVSWVQRELLVPELPAGAQHSAGLRDFIS